MPKLVMQSSYKSKNQSTDDDLHKVLHQFDLRVLTMMSSNVSV